MSAAFALSRKVRFSVERIRLGFVVWDREQKMLVDFDERRNEMRQLAAAMNRLDRFYNGKRKVAQ